MNLNKVAQAISKKEGGAVNLSIAQIKEVMRLFLEILVDSWCNHPREFWNFMVRQAKKMGSWD